MAKTRKPQLVSTEVEGTDIPHTDVTGKELLPVEKQIGAEIAKYNLPRAAIAKMKEQYAGLKITGLDDKEGYESVRVALGIVVSTRTGVEKKRQEIKGDYLIIQRAIDAEAKELTRLIEEVENPLRQEKDRIDQEKEQIKLKKKQEEEQRLHTRVNSLTANGMTFDGSYYSISHEGSELATDLVTIKELSDEKFSDLVGRVARINADKIAAREEQERKEREERERIEQQRKEQEEKDRQLKEEQQRQEIERRKMAQERIDMRTEQLVGLGFTHIGYGIFGQKSESVELQVGPFNMAEESADSWRDIMASLRAKLTDYEKEVSDSRKKREEEEKRKQEELAEKSRREARLNERRKFLTEMFAMKPDVNPDELVRHSTWPDVKPIRVTCRDMELSGTSWDEFLSSLVEKFELVRETESDLEKSHQAENERLRKLALSDSEKIKEFVKSILDIQAPSLESPMLKETFDSHYLHLVQCLQQLNAAIQ